MKPILKTLLSVAIACGTINAQSSTAQENKNKQTALDWYRDVVANGHVELASKYMADNYIEHNPNMSGGRAEFITAMSKNPKKPANTKLAKQPVVAFGKGDYVVLVWEIDDVDAKGKAFKYNNYDVLRFENGKIAEHWDGEVKREDSGSTAQVAAASPAAPQFKNSAEEQKNETFVLNMYRDVLQYHHFELAPKYMAADYIQHNYTDPQGRDPLIEELAERFKPEPLQPEMKVKPNLVITKGDIVLMMTTRKVKDPKDPSKTYDLNHFEMIRVQNGLAQEHWDSSIGPGGKRNQ